MKKVILTVLYIVAFAFSVGYVAKNFMPKTYVTIEFNEARPIRHRMSVYYKGFKIGRTIRMHPSKDYRTTLLSIALDPMDMKLPVNIKAKLSKEKKGWFMHDFIEIIYPTSPSLTYLKDGDVIKGSSSFDLDSFLSAQADSGYIEELKNSLNTTVKEASETLKTLNSLFATIRDTIEDIQPNIIAASQNLSGTTKNLYVLSSNVNASFSRQRLEDLGEDTNQTAKSLSNTIENVEEITAGLKTSVPEMTSIITNVDNTTCNLSIITSGIATTMKKRLGLFRLFFGKPIECH